MDTTQLVVELAKQIEAQQAYHHATFWLAVIAIALVTGGFGAYVVAYFQKRGETRAILADLEALNKQATTIAAAVKRVESDVSHEEWKKRELTTLQREKMEQLMTAALEAAEWCLRNAHFVWGLGSEPMPPDPISVVDSLSVCYFPALRLESLRAAQVRSLMIREARAQQVRRLQNRGPQGDLPPVDPLTLQYVQHLYAVLLPQCEIVARAGAEIMARTLDAPPLDRLDPLPMLNAALREAQDFMRANGRMDSLAAVFPVKAGAPAVARSSQ